MISKLSKYINKEAFIASVTDKIKQYDKIILDSFVSNQCNLNCKHCYFLDYKPVQTPISYDKWNEVIGECINRGIRHFHFSGKEPFADNRIPILLSKLNILQSNNNLFYGLVTNGSLLEPDQCNELLKSNISYLEISLEGNHLYNDAIKGTGHFQKIETLINNIKNKDKVNITSTITNDNIEELLMMIQKMVDIGISKFNIAPLLVFNKNKLQPVKEIDVYVMLDLYCKCQRKLYELQNVSEQIDIRICLTQKQSYDLFVNENILSQNIEAYLYRGKDLTFNVGKHIIEINYPLLYIPFLSQLVVTHEGYIIPCADDIHYINIQDISIGDISKDSISQILLNRETYIKDYLNRNIA